MKKTATVYWLLPAKPERDLFCEVVRILRKEFRAPNFEPHITLFSTKKDRQSPKKVLKQIALRRIRLTARGVGFSSEFTKTLFVRFKSSDALRKLIADLSRAAKSRAKAPSNPHVSLLYKKIPRATKKELAAVMKLPFRSVVFDSIAAVRCPSPSRTKANVEAWKTLAKKSLRR
ncbi:MAG TPA: 2'-5' RNA ligase family protein [Chthoniobacterales bacterium]|jgi:2'-5' RNA ligase|nr:2'-5' RNA ligase family protein [Chthoniobacterales bacterium]